MSTARHNDFMQNYKEVVLLLRNNNNNNRFHCASSERKEQIRVVGIEIYKTSQRDFNTPYSGSGSESSTDLLFATIQYIKL